MDDRPVVPTLRAAVFAAVCVALAETAHRLMSHDQVPFPATMAAFAAVFVLARMAAGRERGFVSINAMMLLVQAVLHVWFNSTQSTIGRPAVAGCVLMPSMAGMDPASMASMPAMASSASMAPMSMCGDHYRWGLMALLHTGNGMLAAHGIAAFACAAWLRHGEAALFRLARALMLVLIDIAVAVRVVCAPAPVVRLGQRGISLCACTAWRPKWLTALRYAVARRGPPQVGFAV
jgi:hypothetical protein